MACFLECVYILHCLSFIQLTVII